MSAFLCSDRHFATVAKWLFFDDYTAQNFADALKRENLKSLRARYSDKNRFSRVNLGTALHDGLTVHDVANLLNSIDYQSCEHADYNDTLYKLASRLLQVQGANPELSDRWAL